jgi:predicted ATPase/DNA-binding CsgD family transcriptional regulator
MSFDRSSLSAFPRPQTSFIGRASETAAIHRELARSRVRLLTLVGPGGVGKTRLALHAALTDPGFDDGRWFVDLAGIADPALVLSQIAQTLGIRLRGDLLVPDQIVAHLDGRDALLVLDNFEHLLEGATVISQLLARTSGIKMLATSRAPLGLSQEQLFSVPPLSASGSIETGGGDAVELFLQRSRAYRAASEAAPADLEAIASICERLAGLPLAIELAAARTRVMAPQAILSRLSQPLRFLASGPHDAPARHRSMREAIGWSYRLLPDGQSALLRAMGVFAGTVPLDGLETVAAHAGIAGPDETIELVTRLVDASMVEAFDRGDDEPRFVVAATVREFVVDELESHGELIEMRDRHAAWMETLAEKLAADFEGPQEHLAFARSRIELDNIRAALDWSLNRGALDRAVRIAGALGVFWSFGGFASEGNRWLDRIEPLLAGHRLPAPDEYRFWVAAGLTAWAFGDVPVAEARYARALELARAMDDTAAQAYAWMWLSQAAWYGGDYAAQHARARQALALSAEGSIPWAGAQTLFGVAEMRLDRLEDARRELEIARQRHAEIGFTRAAIWSLQLLGDLAFLQGGSTRAARAYRESLALALVSDSTWAIFEAFSGLLTIALELGRTAEALELLAGAELMLTSYSIRPREGAWLSERDRAALKAAVAPRDMQRLAQAAAARSLAELVERATQIARDLESGPGPKAPSVARRAPEANAFDLSAREQEVLALLVLGKTDREIAELLSVSHSTARAHVAHVLHKLDARNRAVAVRKALENDLV